MFTFYKWQVIHLGRRRICQLYKSDKVSPPTSRFCGTPASDDQFENFWGHKSWSSARWAAPTSSVERSFSALKRIKTHARNSTGQDRLGALALMSVEKSLLLELKSKDKLYDAALAHFSCKVGLRYKPPWLLFQGIKITGQVDIQEFVFIAEVVPAQIAFNSICNQSINISNVSEVCGWIFVFRGFLFPHGHLSVPFPVEN